MLLLACDTSGPSVSAALWQDTALLAEATLNVGLIHSVTFMPLVRDLLNQASLEANEVSHFAVTTGPGSFTGIRIGISAVKAMAYAGGRTVVGCSSLEVMAWPYHQERHTLVCPLIDARNQRVYTAAWLRGEQLIQPANRPIQAACADLAQMVTRKAEIASVLFLGLAPEPEAFDVLKRVTDVRIAPVSAWLPRAAVLAEMAAAAFRRGEGRHPAEIEATYVARSSAERLYHDSRDS